MSLSVCLSDLSLTEGMKWYTWYNSLTDPFTILQSQDKEIAQLNVVGKRRSTVFEALKLWNGPAGACDIWLDLFREKYTGSS